MLRVAAFNQVLTASAWAFIQLQGRHAPLHIHGAIAMVRKRYLSRRAIIIIGVVVILLVVMLSIAPW